MEITKWVVNRSKQGEVIVFRTEPPMTKEILAFVKTHWAVDAQSFAVQDGFLVMRVPGPPANATLQNIAAILTQAETHVQNEQNQAQKAHERFVQEVTARTGLPAEEA